jgi:hypothetical protein
MISFISKLLEGSFDCDVSDPDSKIESTFFTAEGRAACDRLFQGQTLVIERLCNEIGDLRARIEVLEQGKHS